MSKYPYPKITHYPSKTVKMEPKLFRQLKAICVGNELRSSLVFNNLVAEFISEYQIAVENETKLKEFVKKYKDMRFTPSL